MLKENIENQFDYFEQKSIDIFNQVLSDLKKEYESKDWEIFSSKWRKSHGYIPHGTRKRTITTIFGDLTYYRHRYKYWDKTKYKYVYLSDQDLGIEKYQRMTNHLQIKILSLIAQGKRYRDILDAFPNINFTPRTISNVINRSEISDLEKILDSKVKKVKIEKNLYINVDDTFLTLKENNHKKKYRIRVVLFHTGYDESKSTKNKKVLKNKRIYFYLLKQNQKFNTDDFMEKVYSLAKIFYDNVDSSKVFIGGDGASWIRECHKYWPGSIYIFDKFHAFNKIKNTFSSLNPNLKPWNKKLKSLFNNGKYQDIMKLLDNNPFRDPIKVLRFNDLKTYFKNNKIGIENQNIEGNIGCSIENTISHNIKWLLGYGSKAFSKQTYNKILNVHMAQINGINIIDLVKQRINEEVSIKKQFFRHSVWFNKKIDYNQRYELQGENTSQIRKTLSNYSNIF